MMRLGERVACFGVADAVEHRRLRLAYQRRRSARCHQRFPVCMECLVPLSRSHLRRCPVCGAALCAHCLPDHQRAHPGG